LGPEAEAGGTGLRGIEGGEPFADSIGVGGFDVLEDGEGLPQVRAGFVGLPQVAVGVAQVAQIRTLAATVADLAVNGEGGLQPGNPLLGVQAQIEAIGTGVGEISRQTRGRGVALPTSRGPGLSRRDAGAFQVEQGQAAQDVLTPYIPVPGKRIVGSKSASWW